MAKYNVQKEWQKVFSSREIAYPPEALIRILLGKFPDLQFLDRNFSKKSVLDLGFGDGRNFPLYSRLGMNISAMEISDELNDYARKNPVFEGIDLDLRTGVMSDIPFTKQFDYVVSWNSCYYLDDEHSDFRHHANEMLRVCKPGGFLVVSIPQKTSFIYKNSQLLSNGNVLIKDDYFKVRNGQIMSKFNNADNFISYFKKEISNCSYSNLNSNWFGLGYDWFVLVMQKTETPD